MNITVIIGRFFFFLLRYGLVILGLFCSVYELIKIKDIYSDEKRKSHFLILNTVLAFLYFIPSLICGNSGMSDIPNVKSNIWIILLIILMMNLILSFIKCFSKKPKIWIILGIICLLLLGVFIHINIDIVNHASDDTPDNIKYIEDTYPEIFYEFINNRRKGVGYGY